MGSTAVAAGAVMLGRRIVRIRYDGEMITGYWLFRNWLLNFIITKLYTAM